MLGNQVGFSLDDILEYFNAKSGKVIYSEIVTHFKYALADPNTQAEARILFKDYVNTLATVTNENGKKYLLLRPKYMKRLTNSTDKNDNSFNKNVEEYTNGGANTGINSNRKETRQPQQTTDDITPIKTSDVSVKTVASPAVVVTEKNSSNNLSHVVVSTHDEPDSPPPRPPPRKKNSFSKTKSPQTPAVANKVENQENMNSLNTANIESNQVVKKEIQELSKTPGRVKEHAQILNKLASGGDFKLPMPVSANIVHSHVVNKIRSFNHSDTDSGSVQILDILKKKWILAASTCDFNEMLSLLKEDPNLCSYCDFIMGYNALHWAAKFNKPEIIKLIAGKYAVDPNIKSFSGCTPLHIAAQFKNESIMKMLIDLYGANQEIRDNYGKKPYHYLDSKDKKPNEKLMDQTAKSMNENGNSQTNATNSNAHTSSATENLKNNLRNKISHQSMLVRNTLRKSKAFQRRKSMNEKSKS